MRRRHIVDRERVDSTNNVAKKLADEMGFRWVVGCPPGNADVVKGVLGDRKEYGVRYS